MELFSCKIPDYMILDIAKAFKYEKWRPLLRDAISKIIAFLSLINQNVSQQKYLADQNHLTHTWLRYKVWQIQDQIQHRLQG